MAKVVKKDRSIAITAGVSLLVLVIGFGLTWLYLQYANTVRPDVAYAAFGPLRVDAPAYSIAARLALQTSPGDAAWAKKNHKQLELVFKEALNNADPERIRAPNGLVALQKSLAEASNAALKTTKVQQILFTDFIMQSN